MVPGDGLEPSRSYKRGILNPLCLPIPPPGHCYLTIEDSLFKVSLAPTTYNK